MFAKNHTSNLSIPDYSQDFNKSPVGDLRVMPESMKRNRMSPSQTKEHTSASKLPRPDKENYSQGFSTQSFS